MHGVRMRESFGIDVLRHAEHHGPLGSATAHYTLTIPLASWGWVALLSLGCATPLGASRLTAQGGTEKTAVQL
jgi:hypothetical protein